MQELTLITLATFWCWETLRYAVEQYLPSVYYAARPLQPLVVASLPLYLLWPGWVSGLACAGAVGILHLTVERLVETPTVPVQFPRRRTGGLPPLP